MLSISLSWTLQLREESGQSPDSATGFNLDGQQGRLMVTIDGVDASTTRSSELNHHSAGRGPGI
jgi:hypothetical protein